MTPEQDFTRIVREFIRQLGALALVSLYLLFSTGAVSWGYGPLPSP